MRTTLAELFARTQGAPQNVDGTMVHNIYRRNVANGQLVLIRRIRAVDNPTQGLRVKIDKGTVTVHGRKLKDVVLWADSSPLEVEIQCDVGRRAEGELRLWNCWRGSDGVMQAWLGDAGMVIDEAGERPRIRCSDGTHPFEPLDLEVELVFA